MTYEVPRDHLIGSHGNEDGSDTHDGHGIVQLAQALGTQIPTHNDGRTKDQR